jgi:phosphopantetheinyl transferase (holo-ACP synthase)
VGVDIVDLRRFTAVLSRYEAQNGVAGDNRFVKRWLHPGAVSLLNATLVETAGARGLVLNPKCNAYTVAAAACFGWREAFIKLLSDITADVATCSPRHLSPAATTRINGSAPPCTPTFSMQHLPLGDAIVQLSTIDPDCCLPLLTPVLSLDIRVGRALSAPAILAQQLLPLAMLGGTAEDDPLALLWRNATLRADVVAHGNRRYVVSTVVYDPRGEAAESAVSPTAAL